MKNKGLHQYRFENNPEEERFAKAWDDQNKTYKTLDYLLDPELNNNCDPPKVGKKRRKAAATVIQWLGSSVGQCFLRDLGYTKK